MNEGCKHLSEESQSDIALHITNCFLEMSGHKTYNCEHDKKRNLRAICISDMSDRAFNVYTEFYTHTHNMCWFLRGQIWQEKISENTWKVGKQLELTALNQDNLLKAQQESLEMQARMLKHGQNLENVLESLHEASQAHRDVLMMLSKSVTNLQSWIIGEVSWIDSVVFYVISVFVTFLLTSSQKTLSSRVPISVLLFLNFVLERIICSFISSDSDDLNILSVYMKIYDFVWYSRYAFISLAIITFLYNSVHHKDIHLKNNEILKKIHSQNASILNAVNYLKWKLLPEKNGTYICNEKSNTEVFEKEIDSSKEEEETKGCLLNFNKYYSTSKIIKKLKPQNRDRSCTPTHFSNGNMKNYYNLRSNSRQATPDC